MDLTIKTTSYAQEDQTWLASEHGTDEGESITLQANLFVSGTHYPNGFLKSGIVLGKVTATGLYAQYDNAAVDGRETAVGILLCSIPLPTVIDATVKPQGSMVRHAIVFDAKLIGIDAAGRTDLAGRVVLR